MTTVLEIEGIGKTYGNGADAFTAIDAVSFAVQAGELLCIVGPSGCGKTTLLRCVSGLMPASAGVVRLGDQIVTAPPRSMALVFQDYSRSLLPWMSIQANVTLPLKAQGVPRAERNERANAALAAVHLDGHGHKYPWQLSGGMQQRAAIARALAYNADILLLDEPFASVDAQTRADLEDLLLDVWHRTGLTVLLVTHDIDEAVYLADRVVMLSAAPTQVKEIVSIDLPRPRDQIATKEMPEFAHLRARVFAFIKAESGRDDRVANDHHAADPPSRRESNGEATTAGPGSFGGVRRDRGGVRQ
jgi:NitT/TauT family transport system ATP-binding protein